MSSPLTFPHDYRIIADSEIRPTIVGGQAVNLWAITFLEDGDFAAISTTYHHQLPRVRGGKPPAA